MLLNKRVFCLSNLVMFLLIGCAFFFPRGMESFFVKLQDELVVSGSWLYVLAVAIIVLISGFLLLSEYGAVKLGPNHAKPEYSNTAWFAMLFSAGMGIGLMFFGVAEPIMHFSSPPTGTPLTIDAAQKAMQITFFHWGLHAWAIYALVGLVLAYFSFRTNKPLTLRVALYPLVGDKANGLLGDIVDALAILSTVFGLLPPLAMGWGKSMPAFIISTPFLSRLPFK